MKVNTKPTIVSALGAIPKGPGKVRLIHDCSRPEGLSLNSYAEIDRVQFQTVREATSFLKPGYYMAKVDLESAYRSVGVHPDDYESTGLKWRFPGESQPQYMFDTRLPFGAKRAPGIFHRITQSVKHMMERRGFTSLVVYLDDWLIVVPTKEEYLQGAANIFADTVSRLHSNNWLLQWALLSQVALNHWQVDQFALDLHLHMPPSSLLVLLPQVTSLGTWRNSSTCVSDSSGHKH